MSYIDLTKRVAPPTPPTNHVVLFVDPADLHTKQIDDTGTIIDLAGGGSVSDPLLLSNGAAGAPAYSFTSTPTAGMWLGAADTLNLSTNAGVILVVNGATSQFNSDVYMAGVASVETEFTVNNGDLKVENGTVFTTAIHNIADGSNITISETQGASIALSNESGAGGTINITGDAAVVIGAANGGVDLISTSQPIRFLPGSSQVIQVVAFADLAEMRMQSDDTSRLAFTDLAGSFEKGVLALDFTTGEFLLESETGNLRFRANQELKIFAGSTFEHKFTTDGAFVLANLSADPTAVEGAIYYNTATKHFYGYDGTTWKQLDN